MASRAVQNVIRKGYPIAKNATTKLSCLNKKFLQPTFEEGPSNLCNSITTQSNPSTTALPSRQISQNANELSNTSAYYATVAPGLHRPNSAAKFEYAFDEGPTMSTLDDHIVQQVESIPSNVQKERGYQIIGKVKTSEDRLRDILALGDKRVWS
jgi:hypothetical protein